jgi:hypothetical protein
MKTKIEWSSSLLFGMEHSPLCFAFKIELLHVFRLLNIAEASIVVFNTLGIKHIQVLLFYILLLFKK